MTLKNLTFFGAASALILAFSLPLVASAQDPDLPRGKLLEFDTDGDGAVSRQEAEAPVEQAFAAADTNGDGALSADEMRAFHEARRVEKRAERQARRFAKLDTDGDGLVSTSEFTARPDERFERVDADKDGVLSAEEIEKARKERRQRGKRWGRPGAGRDG